MGIPKFFNYIKKNYNFNNDIIIENTNKKWDYLILDFQSLVYTTYFLFSFEINYFIRLLFIIKYTQSNNLLITYLKYIFNKHKKYFSYLGIDSFNLDILDNTFNNTDIIIKYLSELVIEHIKNISEKYINASNCYDRTYVFFDGVPSIAKIKEQLGRRIYPEVMKGIKYNLFNKDYNKLNEKEIQEKLLHHLPPSIGIGTPIVKELRKAFFIINDDIKGKFNVNDENQMGEAEHQIMEYINHHYKIFRNKKILLASPDADLILLCLINSTKGFEIDIYRESVISEKESSFTYSINKPEKLYYKVSHIILIDKLKHKLNITNKQKLIDICYSLLLLGDDFIPIIPSLSINNLPDIIKAYDKLNTNIISTKIINNKYIYTLNYDNLILLISNLVTIEERIHHKKARNFSNVFDNLKALKKFYFLNNKVEDIENFDKLYLLDSGLVKENGKIIDLVPVISNKEHIIRDKCDEEMIINYLEGCKFIFDIYLNNELLNYKWYYRFSHSPYLSDIRDFFKKDRDIYNIFDYVKNNNKKFLSNETYIKYGNENKERLLKKLILKINPKEVFNDSLEVLRNKYFTYENIIKIVDCDGKPYFNKCFEADELLDVINYL